MKKFGLFFAALTLVFSFATIGLTHEDDDHHDGGHKIVGEVVKTDGPFVMVKGKDGKTHKFHVNKTTHLKGTIKSGAKVEVESTDTGHALSMSVLE